MTSPGTDHRIERWIFIAMLVVRLVFIGIADHYHVALDHDAERYETQSDGILHGNYDLETPLFINAPFYSFAMAGFKWVFGDRWKWAIGIVQLLFCSLSGVYLYRIAKLVFDRRTAMVAAAMYVVFPLTLVWVVTRSQDMPFQIAFIFALHATLRVPGRDRLHATVVAGALFALAFLTKSHILLFAPFIPVHWWLNMRTGAARRLAHIAVFVSTCAVFTLPFGLYNLQRHGIYVISSTGHGGHFLTGHNEDVYRFIVDPPPLGSPEHRRIFNMQYQVLEEIADTLATLPHRGKQDLYLAKGLEWCRENPVKLLELSAWDLAYFLLPGVNPHHYGKATWAALFLISLPLYLLAYMGVWMALRENFRKHSWVLALMLAMIAFSVGFYVQNRFRTITLEPYYIIYAASTLVWLDRKYRITGRLPVLAKWQERILRAAEAP